MLEVPLFKLIAGVIGFNGILFIRLLKLLLFSKLLLLLNKALLFLFSLLILEGFCSLPGMLRFEITEPKFEKLLFVLFTDLLLFGWLTLNKLEFEVEI